MYYFEISGKEKTKTQRYQETHSITEMANSKISSKVHTRPDLASDKQNPSGLGTSPPGWNNELVTPTQVQLADQTQISKQIHTTKYKRHLYLLQYTAPKDSPNSQSPSW